MMLVNTDESRACERNRGEGVGGGGGGGNKRSV